ncbi:MAG: hypothetical protein K6F47_00005, partial [Bacteroidaceae bacterium]|nr:hypothetical protein [Bacteroidaceae bacterium]
NYDVTTENYGYVGLFAVDKSNKIVISNAKVKITSAANHIGTCDLTDADNTAVLGNYILSQNYTYYVMYPYSTTATGLSTLAAGNTSPGSDADTFFANVTAGWAVETDQSATDKSKYKASDLQIAKLSTNFTMQHKMGLAEIELKTATYYMIVEDNSVSPYTTPNRTTNTNINVTASSTFNTSSPYHIPTRKESTSLYYAVVPTGTNSTQFNSTTGIDQWSSAITTTGISSGGVGHYDVYSTRVGTSAYSGSFSYHGTCLTFTVPFTGKYTIECWGASGGYGGKGGYVCGSIDFEANTTLYVYIGQEGAVCGSGMSFNGGGYGRWTSGTYSGCGGGATDVRLTKHSESDGWSGNTSLYSRIIVAGGGGGGLYWYMYGNSISTGANAGGMNGYDGIIVDAHGHESQVSGVPSVAKGGSQTGGGAGGAGGMYANGQNGGLGYGGSSNTTYRNANGAGGGGYYGGGASGEGGWCAATGAGGSSFISGMAGCNGWDNQQNNHAGSSNPTKILVGSTYKTFSFSNCEMIDGAHSMPNPVSSGNEAGHSGNGYCRITGTTATSNL